MNTDFKALCDELANTLERTQKALCFEGGCSDATDNKRRALINRARAALAAEADGPAVPEGREPASVVGEPSDEELLAFDAWSQKAKELWGEFATERSQGTFYKKLAEPDFLNMVQDSVAYPTLRQVSLMADHCGVTDLMAAKRLVHLALDTFGATPPPPVSVTERLPGPGEGPTDEELDRLERQHWEETGVEEQGQRETLFNHRSFARAALARYGHQPAPPAAGEVE